MIDPSAFLSRFNTIGIMSQQKKTALSPFSENLRALRGEISQAKFAPLLLIENQVTYHRYEHGRVPRAPQLQMIAVRLGITVSELLSPLAPDRINEISRRCGLGEASEASALLKTKLNVEAAQEMERLVNDKSVQAVWEAFQLHKWANDDVITLFEEIVSAANHARPRLVKFYVLIRAAITKELGRRLDLIDPTLALKPSTQGKKTDGSN